LRALRSLNRVPPVIRSTDAMPAPVLGSARRNAPVQKLAVRLGALAMQKVVGSMKGTY